MMDHREKRNRDYLRSFLYPEYETAKLQVLKEVGMVALALFSLVAWGYVLTIRDGTARSVLTYFLVVNGIVLVGNLIFYVGLYGYRDNFRAHLTVTYLVTVVLSVGALYISGIDIPAETDAVKTNGFALIVQFFAYLVISLVMSALPAALDCGLMWLIAHIFGERIPDEREKQ